jgi:CubicO group peptidase (beta-lactamase class C family)
MKLFYLIFAILILNISSLRPQTENDLISYPKFFEEQFVADSPQRIIDPAELDSIITNLMGTYHIPGLAALIVKHDSIVWNQNYGYANIGQNKSVDDFTKFIICSISKTIVGTLFMQLWEDGLIDLEDNINDYLQPDFQVINPYHPNDTITVQMLMTHTSSINDNYNVLLPLIYCGDSPVPFDTFLVNYLTPGGIYYSAASFNTFSPSSNTFEYSNVGASLLAYIVQKLTGIEFDQYSTQTLLYPLDIFEASWFLAGMDTNSIATPYDWAGQYISLCHSSWPIYPISQLRIHKLELLNYLKTYMNWGKYGEVTILDSSTVDLMLTVHKQIDPYNNWGLMWHNAILDNRSLWGHTGSWFGGASAMFFYPEEDWGIIMFYNRYPGNEYWQLISPICEYAHIFGDIYAVNTALDKPYMELSDDSIIVRTEFSNFYQHNFTATAIYVNSDSSSVDSIALYDDGLHGDSLANDGIWGGFIHSILEEDYFDLGISTLDTENGKYFYSENLEKFTTVGPVVLFDYEITSNDTTPGAGDVINYELTLENQSGMHTIFNVSTTLKSLDTLYQVSGLVGYGDIDPGETSIGTGFHTITFSNQVTHNVMLPVEIRIASDSILYWIDTLDIITDVEDFALLPNEYSLEQNFPNPFNSATAIQYSILQRSNVTLKIYDILGNEITTLVNEEKDQGVYTVNFDANNLASGLYLYRIQAGTFIDTKKMILLK